MVLGVGIAQNVLSFTLPLLAFEISSTGTGLAIIKGVGFVPNILFAIFIGVINDQIYKRHAFRGYTIGMTLLVALLALAIFMDFISIPALALFMILLNGLAYAIGNTQLTLIRLTVDKEQLADATATTSSVYAIITTIAPALAGFALLQVGHLGVIFGCLLVLISVTFAAFFVNPMETLPKKKPFWSSLTEGWKVFVTNKELVMMTVVIVLTNAAEGAFGTALILKLKTAIQATDFEIGIVMATAGLGAVVTTRFAARLRRYFGYRAAFFWPIWGLALLYLAIILQMPVWALCILSFLEGGLSIFFCYWHLVLPPRKHRGRTHGPHRWFDGFHFQTRYAAHNHFVWRAVGPRQPKWHLNHGGFNQRRSGYVFGAYCKMGLARQSSRRELIYAPSAASKTTFVTALSSTVATISVPASGIRQLTWASIAAK